MIANYDSSEQVKTQVIKRDHRFVNDMSLNQERKQRELDQIFKEAKAKGERFYSTDEILKAKANQFGINESDMNKIKGDLYVQKIELENLYNALKELGQIKHPIAKKLKQEIEITIPASQIYVDHSMKPQDGIISGGGWPYCLDDNGWGYQNFITSDCYKAIVSFWICASDSTLGKMDSDLRYCKAYIRNCSPLISHDEYWHTHAWWQQIP